MTTIQFAIIGQPSRSKGWGRYAVSQGDRRVVESNTGNEWVSSDKTGEAEPGTEIVLRSQVMLRVGKGSRQREEIDTESYTLIVEEGAICEVYHRPGSQGQRIQITGARLA